MTQEDFNENDDRAIDELFKLLLGPDTYPEEVAYEGIDHVYARQYALAEPLLIEAVNKLEGALYQIGYNNESLLAQIKATGFDEHYLKG